VEQSKAMEYGSRKASADVKPRNIYSTYMYVCLHKETICKFSKLLRRSISVLPEKMVWTNVSHVELLCGVRGTYHCVLLWPASFRLSGSALSYAIRSCTFQLKVRTSPSVPQTGI
jgi:hypothetical protein